MDFTYIFSYHLPPTIINHSDFKCSQPVRLCLPSTRRVQKTQKPFPLFLEHQKDNKSGAGDETNWLSS